MSMTAYGDITPRTAAYVARELLERAQPLLAFEKVMQGKTLPGGSTKSMTFRRYNALDINTTELTEGVTPVSKKLTKTDVTCTVVQLGDLVELTDVVEDTHEDPVLRETYDIVGEQAAKSVETYRYYGLRACSNKFYSNGSLRTDINTPLTKTVQNKITRAFKRQDASPITSIIKSTPNFNSESVLPCFIAIGHTDLEGDIRNMEGFIDVKDYGGGVKPMEGEVGAVGQVRYILTNIATPYEDAGGAAGSMITTGATYADVYPVLYFAKHAWAGVALKGAFGVTPIVINPGKPSKSDPLGQRGSVGWKTMQTVVILNDAWMAVAEVAATEL